MRFFAGLIGSTEDSLDANDIREVVKLLNQLRNAKIKAASAAKKKKGKKKTKAKVRPAVKLLSFGWAVSHVLPQMSMHTDDDWLTAQANDDDFEDFDDGYDFM